MDDAPIPIAELEQGPSKFDEFMEKNQKKLMILAGLIFLGVLAYVFMTGMQKKNAAEAGAAFMLASDENDEESYQQVIKKYSSSQTAGTAAMAIAQLRTTDDDRTVALNHFISTYPEHPGIPAKLLELALIQMNAGKNSDAEITLNKLISNENSAYLAPRAKIALADIAASNNELEKAEKIYTEIKDSQAHFSDVATQRLLYLKAKEPALVKKAPAPPVTPAAPASASPIAPTTPEAITPPAELKLPNETTPPLTPAPTTETPAE